MIARIKDVFTAIAILWQGSIITTLRSFHLSYKNGKGYLQAAHRPKRYFAVKMDSGRLGIMRRLKVESYQDFGGTCYAVDFLFTGRYVDELFEDVE